MTAGGVAVAQVEKARVFGGLTQVQARDSADDILAGGQARMREAERCLAAMASSPGLHRAERRQVKMGGS